ncbi:MAG: hypothetical protein KatS3mg061_2379 [Dehalococcoidia bacterium]|nr:MAG: hypothetical protein KatS3mg061_2379 [Dehalococcoidia bacterium]
MSPALASGVLTLFVLGGIALLQQARRWRQTAEVRTALLVIVLGVLWGLGSLLLLFPLPPLASGVGLALRVLTALAYPVAVLAGVMVQARPLLPFPGWARALLVGWLVVAAAVVLLNPAGLTWGDLQFRLAEGASVPTVALGPLGQFVIAATLGLLLGVLALAGVLAVRPGFPHRRQVRVVLLAPLALLLSSLPPVASSDPLGGIGFSLVGPLLASMPFAWILFRDHVIDLAPIARSAVFLSMSDGVVVLDQQRRIVDLNPAAEAILGRSLTDLFGQPLADVLPPALLDLTHESSGRPTRTDLALGDRHQQRDYEVRVSPLHDRHGHRRGWLLVMRDVTRRKALERQLRYQAEYDALTGLANRRRFFDRLERELRGEQRWSAVLVLDLDGFKEVNDRFGHQAGDTVLQLVAARLTACLRPRDLVARLGGDEFAVLLAADTSAGDLERVAERLLHTLSDPVTVAGERIQLSASLGYTLVEPGVTSRRLLHQADVALYAAKASGKNRALAYQPELETSFSAGAS